MTDYTEAISALEHEAEELHLRADALLQAARFMRGLNVPDSVPQSATSLTITPAPTGYVKLPPGTRCRCARLWQNEDDFYCCKQQSQDSGQSVVRFPESVGTVAQAEIDCPAFLRRPPK